MGVQLVLQALQVGGRVDGVVGVGGLYKVDKVVKEYQSAAAKSQDVILDDSRESFGVAESTGTWKRASEYDPSGYDIIPRGLIESFIAPENQLLLPIPFDGPMTLMHGLKDTTVPFDQAIQAAIEAVTSSVVQVRLVKDGDHRLSSERELEVLADAVAEVVKKVSVVLTQE
ncbi:UNVERIFIED_CONTAM: hypothetical protein HDU68_001834 [Siphonaria sp. JEL0065]|nr:hypothetical protein HDU68_001834 [Siphonaria sp. JEL0065]